MIKLVNFRNKFCSKILNPEFTFKGTNHHLSLEYDILSLFLLVFWVNFLTITPNH